LSDTSLAITANTRSDKPLMEREEQKKRDNDASQEQKVDGVEEDGIYIDSKSLG